MNVLFRVLLFLFICSPSFASTEELMSAASAGNVEQVKSLLSQPGRSVNEVFNGMSVLMNAAHGGHLDLVTYLISHEDIVLDLKMYNCTALSYAARQGHFEVFMALHNKGAKIIGMTEEYAKMGRDPRILRFLFGETHREQNERLHTWADTFVENDPWPERAADGYCPTCPKRRATVYLLVSLGVTVASGVSFLAHRLY